MELPEGGILLSRLDYNIQEAPLLSPKKKDSTITQPDITKRRQNFEEPIKTRRDLGLL